MKSLSVREMSGQRKDHLRPELRTSLAMKSDKLFKHSTAIYCERLGSRGLSCDARFLEELKTQGADESYQEQVLRCAVCAGLYKYVFCQIWQERNFDCDRGWHVICDRYFKVEERFANCIPFPVEEARDYGYEIPPLGPGNYSDTPCQEASRVGLTCPSTQLVSLGYSADHKIQKCRLCGEFYVKLWLSALEFHYFRPGEAHGDKVPLPIETAWRYGYRSIRPL